MRKEISANLTYAGHTESSEAHTKAANNLPSLCKWSTAKTEGNGESTKFTKKMGDSRMT